MEPLCQDGDGDRRRYGEEAGVGRVVLPILIFFFCFNYYTYEHCLILLQGASPSIIMGLAL